MGQKQTARSRFSQKGKRLRQSPQKAGTRSHERHDDSPRWLYSCVGGVQWDLIITLDDATSTHYSMFFAQEEGTVSSLRGMRDVIAQQGIPSSFYSDHGSHYWYTPEAGGKLDKQRLTQLGQAMKHLGIQMSVFTSS